MSTVDAQTDERVSPSCNAALFHSRPSFLGDWEKTTG